MLWGWKIKWKMRSKICGYWWLKNYSPYSRNIIASCEVITAVDGFEALSKIAIRISFL